MVAQGDSHTSFVGGSGGEQDNHGQDALGGVVEGGDGGEGGVVVG